jgi:hypothetical protein
MERYYSNNYDSTIIFLRRRKYWPHSIYVVSAVRSHRDITGMAKGAVLRLDYNSKKSVQQIHVYRYFLQHRAVLY